MRTIQPHNPLYQAEKQNDAFARAMLTGYPHLAKQQRERETSVELQEQPSKTEKPVKRDILDIATTPKETLENTSLPLKHVLKCTAQASGLTLAELCSQRRFKHITHWRQIAMYVMRKYTKASLPQIAQRFEKDHTTVLHACRRVDAEFHKFAADIKRVEKML